jgi:hypothetical protein
VVALARDRTGRSNLGCLVTLLAFVAVLYYGVNVGEVYWRYFQMIDAMRSQARLAPSLTDDVIRRRLVEKAHELELPPEAARFSIRRSTQRRTITISTQYSETLELPFVHHTVVLKPRAEVPL